ncbi:MAG: hypothetical protein QOH31_4121 [Verrucomicrobiota bacterium]
MQLLFEMLLGFFWKIRFFGRGQFRQCFEFSLNILWLNLVPESVLQLLNIPTQNFGAEDFRSRQLNQGGGPLNGHLTFLFQIESGVEAKGCAYSDMLGTAEPGLVRLTRHFGVFSQDGQLQDILRLFVNDVIFDRNARTQLEGVS